MADCIFCRLAADPAFKTVYRDERVMAFDDVDPKAPVHVLVVPVEHVESVREVEDAELLAALFAAAHAVAGQRGVSESGYRLVFNIGPDAGQTVFHTHLHLLAGRQLSWPPG